MTAGVSDREYSSHVGTAKIAVDRGLPAVRNASAGVAEAIETR